MKRNGLAEVEKEAFVKTNPSISIHKSPHAKNDSSGHFLKSRKRIGLSYLYRASWNFCIAQKYVFSHDSFPCLIIKMVILPESNTGLTDYTFRTVPLIKISVRFVYISKGLPCLRNICWSLDEA